MSTQVCFCTISRERYRSGTYKFLLGMLSRKDHCNPQSMHVEYLCLTGHFALMIQNYLIDCNIFQGYLQLHGMFHSKTSFSTVDFMICNFLGIIQQDDRQSLHHLLLKNHFHQKHQMYHCQLLS
jgi:hypothetical protein